MIRHLARAASFLALAATILPALLFATDTLSHEALRSWMLAATILWFATAPVWMERR